MQDFTFQNEEKKRIRQLDGYFLFLQNKEKKKNRHKDA
jgi:hypothetical protein